MSTVPNRTSTCVTSILSRSHIDKQSAIFPKKIGPYILGREVGRGGFSVVVHAICSKTNEEYACKIISKRKITELDLEPQFEKEIRIQHRLMHNNIVQIKDILKDTLNYYIFMEYFPYPTLYQIIVDCKKMPENDVRVIVRQLVDCMVYVHSRNVVHRDLKPENVLISPGGVIKLIDFGLATFIGADSLCETVCGSNLYAAPEKFHHKPYNGKITDAWSLGVIIYVMLFGRFPWTKSNIALLIQQMEDEEYFIPNSISSECRNVIESLLRSDPNKRSSIEEISDHEWLKYVDVPYSLETCPNNLIDREDIDIFFQKARRATSVSMGCLPNQNFASTETIFKIDRRKLLRIPRIRKTRNESFFEIF